MVSKVYPEVYPQLPVPTGAKQRSTRYNLSYSIIRRRHMQRASGIKKTIEGVPHTQKDETKHPSPATHCHCVHIPSPPVVNRQAVVASQCAECLSACICSYLVGGLGWVVVARAAIPIWSFPGPTQAAMPISHKPIRAAGSSAHHPLRPSTRLRRPQQAHHTFSFSPGL